MLTKKLKVQQKMEIYTASTQGLLLDMEQLISKGVTLLEEVSKSGYYWTAFHFASHYGQADVLRFIIDAYMEHPMKEDVFNIQTKEGSKFIHSSFS